jgi:hypothetical protein
MGWTGVKIVTLNFKFVCFPELKRGLWKILAVRAVTKNKKFTKFDAGTMPLSDGSSVFELLDPTQGQVCR